MCVILACAAYQMQAYRQNKGAFQGTGGYMTEKNMTMRELPDSEKPYEKVEKYGAGVLSDAELLAVILRTGTKKERAVELARRLLTILPGKNIAGLFQITMEELLEVKGIGRVKAIELLSLTELVKRMLRSKIPKEEIICDDPQKVAQYFMVSMRYLETEVVKLLVLDGKNRISKEMDLAVGTFDSAPAAPREIFYYALKHKAVSILLLHNHPSGEPAPSREDFYLTKRVIESGNLIGIPLVDHIIIGDNCYVSFKESGYM